MSLRRLLCRLFGHRHTMKFHPDGVYWCWSAGAYDCVCKRDCGYRWENEDDGKRVLQRSRKHDPRFK